MKPPLAILGRHSGTIELREGGPPRTEAPEGDGTPVRFPSVRDAGAYLAFWAGDTGAMSRLRHVLHEVGRSRDVSRSSDTEVLHALAAHLMDGSLQVVERDAERLYLNVHAAFRRAAAAARPPAPSGEVVRPETPAAPAPPVPTPDLLPKLEKVQIEGAEVLPEVLQTLEQIDVSLGTLDLASLSLDPTPTGVPDISDAMTEASDSITSDLDAM